MGTCVMFGLVSFCLSRAFFLTGVGNASHHIRDGGWENRGCFRSKTRWKLCMFYVMMDG